MAIDQEIFAKIYAVPYGWWLVAAFVVSIFINNELFVLLTGIPTAYVVYMHYQKSKVLGHG